MEMKLAVTGFGNVGQGLATLLGQRSDEYETRYGVRLLLTGAADRQGAAVNPAGLNLSDLLDAKRSRGTVAQSADGVEGLTGEDFLSRAEADVLVEAASTNYLDAEPGWSYIRSALDRNMDIVLASKGALVLHFRELMDSGVAKGCRVLFSATVGSPVPSLQIAEQALLGTTILGFEGILNGTTHQILTVMGEGATYEEGVRQAQEMGIAETDPTLDVDGWDAAAKATIIANAVLGSNLGIDDVDRTGIRDVSRDELEAANHAGEAIKLIARVERSGARVTATVQPERRSRDDALGRLKGDDMGIVFHTEPLGLFAATVEPSGASGGISTAMTVLRDVLNLARDRSRDRAPVA